MRVSRTLFVLSAVALSLLVGPLAAEAASFKGQMKFTSKAPKEDIFGTADGTADLTIDFADLTKLRGKITVPVASFKTGNAQRDEHLRGADWLDAAQFKDLTFEVTSVTASPVTDKDGFKQSDLKVTGKFTLHGVTVELTAPATIKWKESGQTKITTQFNIKLADFKVAGKDGVVGSKVGETIACEATLTGTAP